MTKSNVSTQRSSSRNEGFWFVYFCPAVRPLRNAVPSPGPSSLTKCSTWRMGERWRRESKKWRIVGGTLLPLVSELLTYCVSLLVSSFVNPKEVRLVLLLLKLLGEKQSVRVGVITPYNAQKQRILEAIRGSGFNKQLQWVQIFLQRKFFIVFHQSVTFSNFTAACHKK